MRIIRYTHPAALFLGVLLPLSASAQRLPESWVNPPPPPDQIRRHTFETPPTAPLVSFGEDGRLHYRPYSERGDIVLDWSHCGYMQSEVPIPDVSALVTLEPLDGALTNVSGMAYPRGPNSRNRIQTALNQVGSRSPDENGIRGAVLLRRGLYFIDGTLNIPSGVVLRGEGDDRTGTVIIAQARDETSPIIHVGAGGGRIANIGESNKTRITNAHIPSGSRQLNVQSTQGLRVGDYIHIVKTANQQWIDDLGMGQRLRHIRGGEEGSRKRPWAAGAYQLPHLRRITSLEDGTLMIDAPLPQSISEEHGGGEVFKVSIEEFSTHAGVESLTLVSNYVTSARGNDRSAYRNFRSGILVSHARDSWVRNCTVLHVNYAAVQIGNHSLQITVRESKGLKPIGPNRGGFRYAFSIGGGSLHLIYNCFSEDGRHDFVGGSRTMGPYAFVYCTAVRGQQSEPHHRWGTGYLFDNVTTEDGSIAAINRGDSGSGHGWAAANTMIWNSNARNIVVFNPETPGENNFAIGYTGSRTSGFETRGAYYANTRSGYWGTPQEGKFFGHALMGSGHIESPDRPVEPRSLFVQQLVDRIGPQSAFEVLK